VTVHTVRSLADHVGGTILGEGAEVAITGINDLRSAQPDQISFFANAKYEADARVSHAAAILVSAKDAPKFSFLRIVVDSPNAAFGKIAALFAPPAIRDEPGIHPTAVVAPDALLGEGVCIAAHAVISAGVHLGARAVIGANCFIGEQSAIGDDTRIYPLVTIRERSVIGARVIVHSGTVIGADGFGYEFDSKTGRHVKITHTGISGSTSLGRYVTLAGQVGLAGHLNIGDRATITAQSGLNKDVPAGAVLSGHHATPIRESLKVEALTRRLPEIVERLKALEEKIRALSLETPKIR
jgi:UDP-3-O-[3-hydroxymyristoyl] glucosamine N-acyltransferase